MLLGEMDLMYPHVQFTIQNNYGRYENEQFCNESD